MSCELTSPTLPKLQAAKRGAQFSFGIDWSCHLAEGESLTDAVTTVERAPDVDATILPESPTSIAGTVTIIAIAVPDDAPYGSYHLRHAVSTNADRQYVECFSVRVEPC